MQFSVIDHTILNTYKVLCDGLADYLGPGYELVLHSLEDLDNSVIHIINGEHTGRKIGSPITNLALSMLRKIQEDENHSPYISYFTKNKAGEPLKSATITIAGENNRIIGLLCINFYLNTPYISVLNSLTPEEAHDSSEQVSETFVDSIDLLLQNAYRENKLKVRNDPTIPNINQNKEIISLLYEQGIFNLKDSVNKVADIMQISKNTVYMHLRNLKETASDAAKNT